jgi:DNA-directed RNA polymerase specialized sigma24 family protein
MQQWTLSQNSFDQFLAVLDPNRERAGLRYEAIRTRIVKFFEWRACRFPDDLADETLDRVMKKIAMGEQIEDPVNYAYGVARFLYLEDLKQQAREQAVVIEMPVMHAADEVDDEDARLTSLERCLQEISAANRSMILHYYRDERQAKIDDRKKLAERFNISVNALRIKALRIRAKLEECVLNCLKKDLV